MGAFRDRELRTLVDWSRCEIADLTFTPQGLAIVASGIVTPPCDQRGTAQDDSGGGQAFQSFAA
jgi:hypothetical protein